MVVDCLALRVQLVGWQGARRKCLEVTSASAQRQVLPETVPTSTSCVCLAPRTAHTFTKLLRTSHSYRSQVLQHWRGSLCILVSTPTSTPLDHRGGRLAQVCS